MPALFEEFLIYPPGCINSPFNEIPADFLALYSLEADQDIQFIEAEQPHSQTRFPEFFLRSRFFLKF